MLYWVYRLAAWLLPRTHEAIGYPLFELIGMLIYAAAPRVRQQVACNMRVALGPAAGNSEVEEQTRLVFRNLAKNYYELFHLPGFSQQAIRARIDLSGVENIDAALQLGKGVLLAGMHFGNTEYLMQLPTFYPYMRFVLLVEKMADARVFDVLHRMRASMGMEMVPVDEPLKIVRALKQNRLVGIAIDRDVTHSGIQVTFMGRTAVLPDGVIRLAMRTGAAIVPAYGWTEAGSKHIQVRVLPAIELTRCGKSDNEVRLNLERVLAKFEPAIHAHAGQWLAFQRIWEEEC
jgi:phosphatidylinositol dimannoside acyltransferase